MLNPLYAQGRSAKSVFLAGLLGVPWQDIAADEGVTGQPLGATELRYKPARQLAADGTWDVILGSHGTALDSDAYPPVASGVAPVAPTDPLMVESQFERPGVGINEINGRDYDTAAGASTADDLQYACIFPLPEPRDCSGTPDVACDCSEDAYDRPLCEQVPGVSASGTTQYWAKAYPGRRQLQVLKDYGSNAVVSSICARNMTEPALPDYGYRPAAAALVEALGSVVVAEQ